MGSGAWRRQRRRPSRRGERCAAFGGMAQPEVHVATVQAHAPASAVEATRSATDWHGLGCASMAALHAHASTSRWTLHGAPR